MIRVAGGLLSFAYAAAIVWAYAAQPQSRAEAIGGLASTLGAYRVDEQGVQQGIVLFHQERFAEARLAFDRADPAKREARTQFYVAYSFYREGWHRLYSDDVLFAQGLAAVKRASDAAPGQRLAVDDPALGMHTADELRIELERGLRRDASDFNPLRVLAPRK